MITDMSVRIACDSSPACDPAWVLIGSSEIDHDEIERVLKVLGWTVWNGEHICPGCTVDEEMRQSASEDGAEHESRCIDLDNARAINAGRY